MVVDELDGGGEAVVGTTPGGLHRLRYELAVARVSGPAEECCGKCGNGHAK